MLNGHDETLKMSFLALGAVLFIMFVQVAYSTRQVTIEFLYSNPKVDDPFWSEDCDPCVLAYEDFLRRNDTMQRIQSDYGGRVLVNWTKYYSAYGQAQRDFYNVGSITNSLIIKDDAGNFTIVGTYFNEMYIRETIDSYLEEPPPPDQGILDCHAYNGSIEVAANITVVENGYSNSTPFADYFVVGNYTINATWSGITQTELAIIVNGSKTSIAFQFGSEPAPTSEAAFVAVLGLAFYFGFFETFSPCLLALLSFVLSYTIGKATRFREGLTQVIVFGIGFVSSAMTLGVTIGLIFVAIPSLHVIMVWVVCILAIVFGLSLLGLDFFKLLKLNIETKPLVQKLSRKYAFTYAGLFLLGFLFYFLDPCLAPFFVSSLPMYIAPSLMMNSQSIALIFLVFSIGVMIPFIGIGLFAGSISKVARGTYRHKSLIKGISGLILIGYAAYLIVTSLL